MRVVCDNCKAKLTVPDNKIPKDKELIVSCPKCRGKIAIPVAKQSKPNLDLSKGGNFNGLALVCIGDNNLQKSVHSIVQRMGFETEVETTTGKALKKLEYHIYSPIIVDDAFDNNMGAAGIVEKLNSMDMSFRRQICLVVISSRFKTNDHMSALHSSVNSIINRGNAEHLEKFLPGIIKEHKEFYTVYNASLKLIGTM